MSGNTIGTSRRGVNVSGAVKKNLRELNASIKKNLSRVQGKACAMGSKPDRAITVSTAKYYRALNKLAQE